MMNSESFTVKIGNKAQENFENIKESIKGLYEILKITLTDKEDAIYQEMGLDNINSLYKNFIELMLNDYGARKLMKKIRNSEIDLDIDFNEC